MNSVILARTASGSTYVLSTTAHGVHWCRIPGERRTPAWTASGWEAQVPRIVPGERLFIGDLLTTPVTSVSILPA
jgi:hypothetical protein